MSDFEFFLQSLPKNQLDSTYYDIRRYWELNDKPKDFEEAKSKGMYQLNPDGYYHANSIAYNPNTKEYEWMKTINHPTAWMEYNSYYWNPTFNKQYNIIKDENRSGYLKYIKRQLGGKLNYLNLFK